MTSYIYQLFVIAPDGIAQALSTEAYSLCPDVGPNNVNLALNTLGDSSEATHYAFSAPVKQEHIDALFDAGLGDTPEILWARTDRNGILQKRHDNESPAPISFSFEDLLDEAGLKLQRLPIE